MKKELYISTKANKTGENKKLASSLKNWIAIIPIF